MTPHFIERARELGLPLKWEVCPTCDGRGTTALHGHAYTADELDELGPEFIEDYAAGRYDETCSECHGRTTVQMVDNEHADPDALAVYDAEITEYLEDEALARSELYHSTGGL